MVYVDFNMVRAGVVTHPSMWPFCGYHEIRKPRKKNVLIQYDTLRALLGMNSYKSMRNQYTGWIEDSIRNREIKRDEKWTNSIAVGSKSFVDKLKSRLIGVAAGRKVKQSGDGYALQEPVTPYIANFEAKNGDIGLENRYFWYDYHA
jgi:putative transposase